MSDALKALAFSKMLGGGGGGSGGGSGLVIPVFSRDELGNDVCDMTFAQICSAIENKTCVGAKYIFGSDIYTFLNLGRYMPEQFVTFTFVFPDISQSDNTLIGFEYALLAMTADGTILYFDGEYPCQQNT